MLENIKIIDHDLIEDTVIKDIPQITIVCGPNNSGKSTLLRLLSNRHKIILGSAITDDMVDTLFEASVRTQGWYDAPNNSKLNSLFKSFIQDAANKQEIWFEDEINDFNQIIRDRYDVNPNLKHWSLQLKVLSDSYLAFLKQDVKAVLLPPKRNLQEKTNVNTNQQVATNGSGLIDALFLAKNNDITSDKRQLFDRIHQAFFEISDGFSFDITLSQDNEITLKFSPEKGVWLNANTCGLGLQDLIIILYFAEAPGYDLVCVEEPESHLHPDMQRRLLIYLREISDRKFFLTTHSNVFLDNMLVDKVIVTKMKNNSITVSDVSNRASALSDLGYSVADNLVSDIVILVEGPTDVPVIREFLSKMDLLKKYDIKVWPLGGDIMDQLDLDVFAQSYRLICILDKDPKSSKIRKRFAKKCKEKGIPVQILKRYAIENYFTLQALRSVFGAQLPGEFTAVKPNTKLESQTGFDIKKNNRRIVRVMDLRDIHGTDLWDFFKNVKSILEN